MGREIRAVAVALVVVVVGMVFAAPALALAPANDGFWDARPVDAVPYQNTVNTTGATLAAYDPGCPGSDLPPSHTVWYRFKPSLTARYQFEATSQTILDATGYPPTITVTTGPRSAIHVGLCGAGRLRDDLHAGTTYRVMVGSVAPGPGGIVAFRVTRPMLPTIRSFTVGGATVNTTTGIATVLGTLICGGSATGYDVNVNLRQQVAGYPLATAYGYTHAPCTAGVTTRWSTVLNPYAPVNGTGNPFRVGYANITNTYGHAYDVYDAATSAVIAKQVWLHRG